MPEVQLFNKLKEVIGEIKLPASVFEEKPKEYLFYKVVRWQLANKRMGTASTKDRGEVSGSTRKLFRQKGTGNARAGSIKSPLRRGGGVIFGPHPRDFSHGLPKKVRRKALISALAYKVQSGNFVIIDNIDLETPRTKDTLSFLKKFEAEKSSLIVVSEQRENLRLGARNIPGVKVMHVNRINVFDILKHQKLMIEKQVLETLERRLARQ